ncbi:Tim44 domain-containing protein [Azospirillum halopraeferens]|uniref:Tim44 domain-containing protein n=1 Tax=Azospirillum halopraeferens TaxID=34010 RepID=UPI0004142DAE|nr:TIM44-like domain-containing protein [Azospirillum halopraeferens]
MLQTRSKRTRAISAAAAALVVALAAGVADARAGRSSNLGSRGDRTYQAPPPTTTAPSTAAPVQRSATQPGTQPGAAQTAAPRPGAAAPATGGFFSRGGFMGGMMGGLIGAGLIGMLMGGGFFSGLGSLAGMLGFLLQIGLVALLVYFAVRWFKSRNRPAYAGATPSYREAAPSSMGPLGGGVGGGMSGGAAAAAAPRRRTGPTDELGVKPDDYESFERLLGSVQDAYAREDMNALRSIVTPEMASYFQEEIEQNAARGVANRISDVRLLQGDLAEAWREGAYEYATVAMRYALVDVTVERDSGRVVEGNADQPIEVIELWTFRRPSGGIWMLSAIQQSR